MLLKTLPVMILFFMLGFITAQISSSGAFFAQAQAQEQASPSDWIKDNQIHVYKNNILIDVNDAEWAEFEDTNSMDPVLDKGANALQFKPSNPDQINVGDIISYHKKSTDERIIHRVIFKGLDEKGIYFILKGDNNPVSDPGKIRFENIDRVLFAIIY